MIFQAKDVFSFKNENEYTINKSDENYIFTKLFQHDFTYDEFKNILLKNSSIKRHNKKRKLFTSEGGPYDKVYYFVSVPKNCLITLKHQKMVISYIRNGAWIGVVEFIAQLFDDSQRKWQIGLEADNPDEEEMIWLEWDKDYFHKIFKKYKATSFLKKLLMNWIKYLSYSIYKMDDHVATALGVITNKQFNHFSEALPLFRYKSSLNLNNEEEQEIGSEQHKLLDVNDNLEN